MISTLIQLFNEDYNERQKTMQKTIKEWLETLPEPYRTQALANTNNPHAKVDSLLSALKGGFIWMKSPEGDQYWKEVADGKSPVILTSLPPTCAIEALMTIALKKGFDVQDIESIERLEAMGSGMWRYQLKENEKWFIINLIKSKP